MHGFLPSCVVCIKAVVKSKPVAALAAAGLLSVGMGLPAESGPAPRLKPAKETLSGVLPKSCMDLVSDAEGHLWCLDSMKKNVVEITPAGKVTETLEGEKAFPGGLEGPGSLSLWGHFLAVNDANHRLHIVDLKTKSRIKTIPYEVMHGDLVMNPSAGFSLWNDRVLFTGLGFEGAPPPFGQPAKALTLFSTGLDGRGLAVLERETLSASARPGRTLLGFGFSAPVPGGGMAVCQAIPGRLMILGPEGKVVREKVIPGFEVPVVPHAVLAREDLQADLLAATPHVAGLFTLKGWIALLVQRPSPLGPRLSVAWFTSDLDAVKEEGIEWPFQLTKWDILARVIHDPTNGVLFLVRHQEPGVAFSSRVYRSQVQ